MARYELQAVELHPHAALPARLVQAERARFNEGGDAGVGPGGTAPTGPGSRLYRWITDQADWTDQTGTATATDWGGTATTAECRGSSPMLLLPYPGTEGTNRKEVTAHAVSAASDPS